MALDALEEEYMGEGYKERKAQELDQARMDPKTESPNTFFNRIMQSLLVVEPDKPELHESMARTIFLNGLPHQIRMMVKDKHEWVAPLEDNRKTAERLYINRMNAPIEGFAMPAFSEMSAAEGKDDSR